MIFEMNNRWHCDVIWYMDNEKNNYVDHSAIMWHKYIYGY